ncbi:MAG: NTP transferase domain-containing protein [Deltaproteobacteria bacterium]|nr:NTP transferase domain-containing protein [Deltaproteobacteria bacterium]
MKAILLAAGQGSRLMPLTQEQPKCMVPLYGKPLIEHIINALKGQNTLEVTLVTGYKGNILQEHLLKTFSDVRFSFVTNDDFSNSNMVHSLFLALRHQQNDVLISYTDIVYEHQYFK